MNKKLIKRQKIYLPSSIFKSAYLSLVNRSSGDLFDENVEYCDYLSFIT